MSDKIIVPTLGESVTEATVSKWLKNQGEAVSADEPVVELETDKVNVEVPAPSNGVLENISVKEGETVNVGALLGIIVEKSKKFKVDKIAAIESRGFVFASAVSYLLKKPFIMLRKKNKLPADTHSVDFELEYGTATIEVHKDSIEKNDSILIIDDLIATGGTAEAAAKLVEISGGKIAAFVFAINLFDLGGSDKLAKKGYNIENLMNFPGH